MSAYTAMPSDAICRVETCGHRYDAHSVGSNCDVCNLCDRDGVVFRPEAWHDFVPMRLAGGAVSPSQEREAYRARDARWRLMPYDIRRTRPVEPDEIRFVSTRDGERERCVVCLGFFVPDEPRVPMPAIGVIPAGNAHNRCASLARPGYDRALALGDNVRAKLAFLPRPLRRTA